MSRNQSNVSRVSITIHPSGWVLIAVFITFGCKDLGWTNGVLGGLLVVISLFLHELAHMLSALAFGVPVYGIGIRFLGAYTHRRFARRPWHDALIAASGPFASLILTLGSFFVPRVGFWLAAWNCSILALNLLPFPGTDGYRVLKSLFWPDPAIYSRPFSIPTPSHARAAAEIKEAA
jgi:Zn-dependent protease